MVVARGGTERGSVLATTTGVDRRQRREWKLKGRGERSFFGRKERLLTSQGEKRDPFLRLYRDSVSERRRTEREWRNKKMKQIFIHKLQ